MVKLYLISLFSAVSLLALSESLAQSKAGKKPVKSPAKAVVSPKPGSKPAGNPAPASVKKGSAPGNSTQQMLENQIPGAQVQKENLPYKPNLETFLAQTNLKNLPVNEKGILTPPFIILAPKEQADQDRFVRLVKMIRTHPSRVKSVLVKNVFSPFEIVAVAFNHQSTLLDVFSEPQFASLPVYAFSGIDAISASQDPYVQHLNRTLSLAKLIAMQNTDFMPLAEEAVVPAAQLEIK
jgi:hypothetical protein